MERIMEGFVYKYEGNCYFLESERKNRNNADAQIILKYICDTLGKNFTMKEHIREHEFVKKYMFWAKVEHSFEFIREAENETEMYYFYMIHKKDGDFETIDEEDFIIIK